MIKYDNRSAYVKSPFQFEVRDNPLPDPGPGQILVEIAACGICGTDLTTARKNAENWQVFGHEASGTVRAVGEGVTGFSVGDRVALDSSAPCGVCDTCSPAPFGRGRPDLCRSVKTYWASQSMGFSNMLITPYQCAVHVPDSIPPDVASLVEPLGVSFDLVETAGVGSDDVVLIIGPGPLGLGAVALARKAGAERVIVAGRSGSRARMRAAAALGADDLIEMDKTPLGEYDFGSRKPDKILVTAPPVFLPEAIGLAAFGGVVAFIGIASGPETMISIDADTFHFNKTQLRASHASPGTHAKRVIRILETMPELGPQLISHRFELDGIAEAFSILANDKAIVKKMVMVNQ